MIGATGEALHGDIFRVALHSSEHCGQQWQAFIYSNPLNRRIERGVRLLLSLFKTGVASRAMIEAASPSPWIG